MKTQKDSSGMTRLQGRLAVASFSAGVLIACICLFFIPPPGEISTSAISITSELLILCGALLGIKVSFDVKQMRFDHDIDEIRRKIKEKEEDVHDEE